MYEHIVGQTSCHQRFILLIYFFHQRFHDLPPQKRRAFSCRILYYFQEFIEAFFNHFIRHLICHGCRRSSRSLGINKRKSVIITHFFHNINRLFHIFQSLTGKSHDKIRCDGNIRHRSLNLVHQSKILLFSVTPVHRLQNSIGTGLHRKMEMSAYFFGFAHDFNQLVR